MDKILRDKKAIVIFIAPALIVFTFILFVPILQVVYYSLCDYDALTKPEFVGLKNYIKLFTDDETMRIALKNSLFFMIFSAVSQQVMGIIIAVLLTNIKRGRNFFKNVYYLPCVLSSAALGLLWAFMFNPKMGINQMLAYFGIEGPMWLYDTSGFKSPNTTSKDVRAYNNKIANAAFKLNGKMSKLSIMQVNTNRYITDIEGINIVKEELKDKDVRF